MMALDTTKCPFYNSGQCAMSGSCELQDCEYKHPIRYFLSRVKYFFNFVNKYYAIMLEWNCYKRDIISLKEFLYCSWFEFWRF